MNWIFSCVSYRWPSFSLASKLSGEVAQSSVYRNNSQFSPTLSRYNSENYIGGSQATYNVNSYGGSQVDYDSNTDTSNKDRGERDRDHGRDNRDKIESYSRYRDGRQRADSTYTIDEEYSQNTSQYHNHYGVGNHNDRVRADVHSHQIDHSENHTPKQIDELGNIF